MKMLDIMKTFSNRLDIKIFCSKQYLRHIFFKCGNKYFTLSRMRKKDNCNGYDIGIIACGTYSLIDNNVQECEFAG